MDEKTLTLQTLLKSREAYLHMNKWLKRINPSGDGDMPVQESLVTKELMSLVDLPQVMGVLMNLGNLAQIDMTEDEKAVYTCNAAMLGNTMLRGLITYCKRDELDFSSVLASVLMMLMTALNTLTEHGQIEVPNWDSPEQAMDWLKAKRDAAPGWLQTDADNCHKNN